MTEVDFSWQGWSRVEYFAGGKTFYNQDALDKIKKYGKLEDASHFRKRPGDKGDTIKLFQYSLFQFPEENT